MGRSHRARIGDATLALVGAGALLAAAAGSAVAAGFALKEQSSAALGNAFAGATSEAADISYMFYNPAGLTRHEGNHVLAGASHIIPRSDPKGMAASTSAALGSVPVAGGNGGDDAGLDATVPVLYGMLSLDERLKAGLGVNIPFGLETQYNPGWVGRYHALKSELMTINVNPVVAYQMTDWLSLGAGLQAQYADAKLSNSIDFGSIGAATAAASPAVAAAFAAAGVAPTPTAQDGRSKLEGDDWAFGGNVGVLVEPHEGTRLGVAYRSRVDHTIDGNVDFIADAAGVAAVLRGATGAFVDTGASADLTTPDMVSVGVYHELNERWAVMGEAQWTNWSVFDRLVVNFDNPAQTASVTREAWEDSWFFALGATYRPSERWALRAGVAYDESPIPDSTRTPRVPGEDRQWIALGAHYEVADYFAVDFGYTHIFVNDSDLNLSATDVGNAFRGNLTGRYENAIDIVTLQGRFRF